MNGVTYYSNKYYHNGKYCVVYGISENGYIETVLHRWSDVCKTKCQKKYKCLDIRYYEPNNHEDIISFCKEGELTMIPPDSEYYEYKYRGDSEDFDELYYPVYDCDGREQVFVRNAYKPFKDE